MYNDTIIFYSKNPPNKWVLWEYNISFWEENRICGDDLKVYMKIDENWVIQDWSFEGDTAIITTACASIFWESIVWMHVEEVLKYDYFYIEDLIGMPVSTRRKQASVLGLLTTRNAIHKYLRDWVKDIFSDVIRGEESESC